METMKVFYRSLSCLLLIAGVCALPFSKAVGEEPSTEPELTPATKPYYGLPSVEGVTVVLNRILTHLDTRLVTRITDPSSGKSLRDPAPTNPPTTFPSDQLIGTVGYPAGVAYAGILAAGDATGDKAFNEVIARRFQFFADTEPPFEKSRGRSFYHNWITPDSLDACGAMGAAFIKARRAHVGPDLTILIDRFADFITHKQFRLPDGTLARRRPFPNSIWADDMYMSVPLLAQLGALTNNQSYFDDAARQVTQIAGRLFVPSAGLFTHGWHESVGDDQPRYYWGRANGWCMMAMVELLDVLPADHPRRAEILALLRAHARGIASLQSKEGLWHQLLDRPESYPETSASAMFTFGIAKAVNHGWLDADTFAPVAIAGWNGLTTRIESDGRVIGTCVGTSYACDYPYYYNRTFTDDQHGYGATLMAGAEIIKLLNNPNLQAPKISGGVVILREKMPTTAP
jgi:rhamnogalacturonyl hydrolase YesR